ncbi:MAG: NAD(+) synthase, partial [Bacteroidales bacterium]|nr:NAD(+) synthase [Bacteroidales bacterium]
MENYGFLRVAAATPVVKLADPAANADRIIRLVSKAYREGVSLIAFPELSITGYTCGDLFTHNTLLQAAERGIEKIIDFSFGKNIVIVVGVPVKCDDKLLNCAAVICDGALTGLVPKMAIPSYNEFYETRWFASGEGTDGIIDYAGDENVPLSTKAVFSIGKWSFCCEICEDLWTAVPPSSYHCLNGALLTINLSASNEVVGKQDYRRELVAQQSARAICGYVYCSAGYGESTQDLVFGGSSMIYEYGARLCENERFQMEDSMLIADIDCEKLSTLRQKSNTWSISRQLFPEAMIQPWDIDTEYVDWDEMEDVTGTDFSKKLHRPVDPHPFVPEGAEADKRCMEILSTQVLGLATRLSAINCRTAVVGVSGGLDSSLALLVAVLAADRCGWTRDRVVGITMPGYGTTGRTLANAEELMQTLGITTRNIPIAAACDRHFADIGHDHEVRDVTYENVQARERTQILMDVANEMGGIVIGTGDLSELALGWATYNGD